MKELTTKERAGLIKKEPGNDGVYILEGVGRLRSTVRVRKDDGGYFVVANINGLLFVGRDEESIRTAFGDLILQIAAVVRKDFCEMADVYEYFYKAMATK